MAIKYIITLLGLGYMAFGYYMATRSDEELEEMGVKRGGQR